MDMDVDKYTRTCSTCKTSYSIFDIEHVSQCAKLEGTGYEYLEYVFSNIH